MMTQSALRIDATGMCCAVGMSTTSACAAIRAGVDHYQKLAHFMDCELNPIFGACVPNLSTEAAERMEQMFTIVTDECLSQIDESQYSKIPLILLTGEQNRYGLDSEWAQEIFERCTEKKHFHNASRICNNGKTSIGVALLYAKKLLFSQIFENVLIVGVDSLLIADSLYGYMLSDRLFTTSNSDGFIPGEGAGAILLSLKQNQCKHGLHITGIGEGFENGNILQQLQANRANGMSTAIRAAVSQSGKKLFETNFHCGDCCGESYYFKEISHAILRCLEHALPQYPHLVISTSVGETGAAAGPLLLAFISQVLGRDDGYGKNALLHFSADSGERIAAICEWY